MPALGQKRTLKRFQPMSAFLPKANIPESDLNLCANSDRVALTWTWCKLLGELLAKTGRRVSANSKAAVVPSAGEQSDRSDFASGPCGLCGMGF